MVEDIRTVQEAVIIGLVKHKVWAASFDLPPHPWALISIGSLPSELAVQTLEDRDTLKKFGCECLLPLVFADISKDEHTNILENKNDKFFEHNKQLIPIMRFHCFRIVDFLDSIKENDIKTLVVQCAAGVSRSGAIAVFASRYLKMDQGVFQEHNKLIYPKQYILDLLFSVAGLPQDYEPYWKKEIPNGTNIFFT